MFLAKGKDRIVLAFPALGFVVKFPIIWLRRPIADTWSQIKTRRWKSLVYIYKKWAPECRYVISGMLLRGIVANQRERMISKRARSEFPQPTFFSFFGLLNIQRYGAPCDGEYLDLWLQIRKITRESAYKNPHQFSIPSNYCLVNGKLHILDYGGHGSAWVVLKYGKKIVDEFDPEFRCDPR